MVDQIRALLNSEVYLGGAPFNSSGDELYQLHDWSRNAQLESLHFTLDKGDATQILLQFYDRECSGVCLHELTVGPAAQISFEDNPIKLMGAKKDRLYLRITAIDSEGDNHCKAVFAEGG